MRWESTSLTITSGGSTSPVLDLNTSYGTNYVRRLLVFAPTTLPETVVLAVSHDGATFVTLQSGAVDIGLPQGKATQINGFQARYIRFTASGAVAADRVFNITIAAE